MLMIQGFIFVAVLSSAVALSWVKAGSGTDGVCAGIETTCSSVVTCTKHAFGPCTTATDGPKVYLQGNIEGMAFIKSPHTDYLTNLQGIGAYSGANNGYREFDPAKTAGDAEYAFIKNGVYLGDDPAKMGGFAGMAFFVMKKGSIATKVNDFMVGTGPGKSQTASKSVCIAPSTTAGTCGDNVEFKEGDVKFSIYFYVGGSAWELPTGTTYIGVRTKLSLVDTTNSVDPELTFNGGSLTTSTVGTNDVTSLKVVDKSSGKGINLNFPTKYNVGTIEAGIPTHGNTRTVKIKVAKVPGENALYLDYLFDKADVMVADRYVVYDPTVKTDDGPTVADAAVPFAQPTTWATALFVVIAVWLS